MQTVLIPMSIWDLTVKSIFRRRDMDMFYIPSPLHVTKVWTILLGSSPFITMCPVDLPKNLCPIL